MVKNLPANAGNEARVRFLGWEDPMKEEMATNSSILDCEVPRTEEPAGSSLLGPKESNETEHVKVKRCTYSAEFFGN